MTNSNSNHQEQQIIASAQQTIQTEIAGLQQLYDQLDHHFAQTVQYIGQLRGRLVVTGIGKSAIIAQKIVATLNSTGTPALFMHAADAIHGDLGMITPDDAVLCLSKSGETPEIKALIPLLKRRNNYLIALTGNRQSYLATQARWILDTTVSREACPHNLAPTTSTTAQLAMGDALAVALLDQRSFSAADFAQFHPGGALGKQLYLTVADLYTQNHQPAVLPTATFNDVVMAITSGLLGAAAVVDQQHTLLGIITDGDLRRALLHHPQQLHQLNATHLMNSQPKTIPPQQLAAYAYAMMQQHKITQLVVTRPADEQYLGILHIHNLIREGFM